MTNLANQYDTLTADERLRLYIAAAARKDLFEMDNLDATCPQKKYKMNDADYSWPKNRLAILTLACVGDLNKTALKAMTTLTIYLSFLKDKDSELADKCGELIEKSLSRYLSLEHAWRIVCERHGYDATDLEKAHFVHDEYQRQFLIEIAKSMEIDEDAEATEEAVSDLERIWPE